MENKKDNKDIYILVAKRIKLFRQYRKMTQEELAEKSLYSPGLIGNIDSPKTHQTFSLAVLYALARALDIPMELFVKEDITHELKKLGITADD